MQRPAMLAARTVMCAVVFTLAAAGCRTSENPEGNPTADVDVQTSKPDNDMKAKLQDMKEKGVDPAFNLQNRDGDDDVDAKVNLRERDADDLDPGMRREEQ
jgi:hypothetical protein